MTAENRSVGLGDIRCHFAANRIELKTILEERCRVDPSMRRRLERAIESTGQNAIRFPAPYEDPVTMAANAAQSLLDAVGSKVWSKLRYLAAGTESAIDHSKPLSAYAQGLLQRQNPGFPDNISTYQVQHACAGATIAMLGVAAQLALGGQGEECGIVLASDVARYEAPSTAEITQGAGAVALLVQNNPALISFDLATQGLASADVDDFFRPLGSVTARVKGQYSMQCYHDAANRAFLDHCQRSGEDPATLLRETDWFVFHVPFARMAYTAARSLLTQHMKIHDGEVDSFLSERGFFEALEATAEVGNIYTGASYLNLASLLWNRYQVLGDAIVGKRILFSSYGSGNTMLVFRATVCAGAPAVIKTWNLPECLKSFQSRDFAEYQAWLERSEEGSVAANDGEGVPAGEYFLSSIREDGYRVYQRKS